RYPLDTAPGPLGTEPDLALAYSSGATNARHTPTTPAESAGEGWAITLGSITAEKYPDGTTWYAINDTDNVSDRLIPDTTGPFSATDTLPYLKMKRNASLNCFQVWDTGGDYREFGCSVDSLQYYVDSSGNRTIYRYDLNRLVPVNQGPGTDGRVLT